MESECDVTTRMNTRLTQHIEALSKHNDDLRKKLKQHRDRERREKEAAEQAAREQQEIEDAKNSHLPGYVPKAKLPSTNKASNALDGG